MRRCVRDRATRCTKQERRLGFRRPRFHLRIRIDTRANGVARSGAQAHARSALRSGPLRRLADSVRSVRGAFALHRATPGTWSGAVRTSRIAPRRLTNSSLIAEALAAAGARRHRGRVRMHAFSALHQHHFVWIFCRILPPPHQVQVTVPGLPRRQGEGSRVASSGKAIRARVLA